MQGLEKILEEIEKEAICISSYYVSEKFRDKEDLYVPLSDVNDVIRKLMNDGWIPVSIRMPEKAGTYIINVLDGERDIVTFAKWQNRYKRFDMTGARAYWRIIAWRPLPEPYQAERSEVE